MGGVMKQGVVYPTTRTQPRITDVADRLNFTDRTGIHGGLNPDIRLQIACGVSASKQHAMLLRFVTEFLRLPAAATCGQFDQRMQPRAHAFKGLAEMKDGGRTNNRNIRVADRGLNTVRDR